MTKSTKSKARELARIVLYDLHYIMEFEMQILKKSLMTLALAGVAFSSQAAIVEVKFANPIFGAFGSDGLTIQYANTPGNFTSMTTKSVGVGRFQGAVSNVPGGTVDLSIFVDSQTSVLMYCYDIYQLINHGDTVTYSISTAPVNANTLDFLGAVNSVINPIDPYAWLHPINSNQGAAVQLGIWESLYDTDWSLSGGNFRVTTGMDAGTGTYLNAFKAAMAGSGSLNASYALVLTSGEKQDMITGKPGQQPGTQVPEPGSLALLGLALAGLAASRRKRDPAAA